MGVSNSKPGSGPSQHVFAESTPTSFSPSLVNSLDGSNHSDKTRESNLELKIQSRITSELEKLASQASSALSSSTSSASSAPDSSKETDTSDFSTYDRLTGAAAAEQERKAALSHKSVSKEIEELKRKLDGRKKVEKADGDVEKARDELVNCLRINDRRPLDCWEQREAFKREVGRLERGFVERTIR